MVSDEEWIKRMTQLTQELIKQATPEQKRVIASLFNNIEGPDAEDKGTFAGYFKALKSDLRDKYEQKLLESGATPETLYSGDNGAKITASINNDILKAKESMLNGALSVALEDEAPVEFSKELSHSFQFTKDTLAERMLSGDFSITGSLMAGAKDLGMRVMAKLPFITKFFSQVKNLVAGVFNGDGLDWGKATEKAEKDMEVGRMFSRAKEIFKGVDEKALYKQIDEAVRKEDTDMALLNELLKTSGQDAERKPEGEDVGYTKPQRAGMGDNVDPTLIGNLSPSTAGMPLPKTLQV